MQDIEFTIQRGKLWLLQTRNGKRTAAAGFKIAVDMAREGLIDKKEAVARIVPASLDQLLHPTLDPKAQKKVIAKGLPASPGAATGQIVFDPPTPPRSGSKRRREGDPGPPGDLARGHPRHARRRRHPDRPRRHDQPRGGRGARHGQVLRRGLLGDVRIDERVRCRCGNVTVVKTGDFITLDGSTGEVILGRVPTVRPRSTSDFAGADEVGRRVPQARRAHQRRYAGRRRPGARKFGAEGIGLCRTEHMFFEADRILAVREMILADDAKSREAALAKILPMQKGDFKGIFREMKGLPVTIRLLDPPLHEFLPSIRTPSIRKRWHAKDLGVPFERLKRKAESLHEFNPMLGHRGCRLGISFPEIYRTQVRAIMEAACELVANEGFRIVPEIMIPLVGDWRELKFVADEATVVEEVASEVLNRQDVGGQKPPALNTSDRHDDRAAARVPDQRR